MLTKLKIYNGEIIELSEFTLTKIRFMADPKPDSSDNFEKSLKSLYLEGIIPPKLKDSSSDEIEEIDAVKKLARWALVIPGESECYRNLDLKVKTVDKLVTQDIIFKNAYSDYYEETFSNDTGVGAFSMRIREGIGAYDTPEVDAVPANLSNVSVGITKLTNKRDFASQLKGFKNLMNAMKMTPGANLDVNTSLNMAYDVMDSYLESDGAYSEADFNECLKFVAQYGPKSGDKQKLLKFPDKVTDDRGADFIQKNVYPDRDANRYDTEILAWSNYWNDKTKNDSKIDTNIIKSMIATESRMGYNDGQNGTKDVMQSLDPRNSVLKIAAGTDKTKDGVLETKNTGFNDGLKRANSIINGNEEVTPSLSIAIGVQYYNRKRNTGPEGDYEYIYYDKYGNPIRTIDVAIKDKGIQRYNGSGDPYYVDRTLNYFNQLQ